MTLISEVNGHYHEVFKWNIGNVCRFLVRKRLGKHIWLMYLKLTQLHWFCMTVTALKRLNDNIRMNSNGLTLYFGIFLS
jgi:hypothetical protein